MRLGLRTGALAAALVLAVPWLASCGATATESGIVRAKWGDPQNPLEPANTNEVNGGKVLDMIFRGLKIYDPVTAEPKYAVAKSITSDDAQNFKVTLKDGWKFADGTKVTSQSFVDAWNYAAYLPNAQIGADFFGYIDGYDKVHPVKGKPTAKKLSGLKVVDDTHFTVRLNQKFSLFPDMLGYAAFSPLPKKFFTDHDQWLEKPFGNGPYEVTDYERGGRMKLRLNHDYNGTKPRNKGVDLLVYTDDNTAYTDVVAGQLDVTDAVPAEQLSNLHKDIDNRYINTPAGIIQTLMFPMYDKRWDTADALKVRRGISLAINREQITDKIFQKTRIPAKDWTSPVLREEGGYNPDICGDRCAYNPKKAKQLIDEGGGFPGGKLVLSYNADTGNHKQWIDAICNSVNRVMGDSKACVGNPVGTFADFRTQIQSGKFSGPFRSGWQMDYPLIQNFLQPVYTTGAPSNDGKWSDKEFDALINKANADPDPKNAIKDFQDSERILAEQLPAIPLWYQNGTAVYGTRVHDVKLNPFSVPVFEEMTVSD
ncbi:ABC transporter substrate-binding protein [Streptomyces sp. NPDC102360]|uniref:peptide ABC transporter substrate-binding protein n=1 Tax=Streptomyces sp. NPDC102360 TaxID=3366160 RepID=UPI0038095E4F